MMFAGFEGVVRCQIVTSESESTGRMDMGIIYSCRGGLTLAVEVSILSANIL